MGPVIGPDKAIAAERLIRKNTIKLSENILRQFILEVIRCVEGNN